MRGLAGFLAILIVALSVLGSPRSGELDPPAVDAALAQTAAWLEAESTLYRLLIYVRCELDRWMVETNGANVREIDLPNVELGSWSSRVSEAALAESASEVYAAARVELTRNPGPGGLSTALNDAFNGGTSEGSIRVRGWLNVTVGVKRGLAEAWAQRSFSFTVAHPLRYYTILDAHEEAAERIGDLADEFVYNLRYLDSEEEVLERAREAVELAITALREVERVLSREYEQKGVKIWFEIAENGTSVDEFELGEFREVVIRTRLAVRVWVEDPEVEYWWLERHKGWACFSELGISVTAVGFVPNAEGVG